MNCATKIAIAGSCMLSPVGVTAASADPTTLVCNIAHEGQEVGQLIADSPTTIDLNEAQGTITIHYGGFHDSASSFRSMGGTTGPFAAMFTDKEITVPKTTEAGTGIVINRVTGFFDVNGETYNCQPGHKQF